LTTDLKHSDFVNRSQAVREQIIPIPDTVCNC